ncbi:hypothetical protein [uncultured Rubinisphaera sp.]|uniref:hypothetical protein n=1 Tax=uncultured Rubinisphaera sp. TaxID=1678686 RepID=UPI0030DA45E2
MIPLKQSLAVIVIGLLIIISGCEDDPDDRLSTLAERYAERQAEQSRQTVALQQEVAAGSRELVAADAQARQELVTIQRELHSQREGLDQQRDRLEQERRELASSRYWESLLGVVIQNLGLIVLCLLPLTICWLLLRQTSEPVSDQEVAELLLNDLTSDEPQLWPQQRPLLSEQTPEIASSTEADSSVHLNS